MKSKKYLKLGATLFAMALCGCQQVSDKRAEYMRNRSGDYLKSSLIAPLRVPEGLSRPSTHEAFPIPKDLPPLGSLQPVPLEPPGFGKLG